ncbi:hypothetical protein ANCCAN_15433 [Ancylostoma caninum]|uniref:Uncharacterized protein n=1 Tax=Ancylostoma caninum TaxID=29170 RepID=A0A368G2H1_ANCCA|nr:hypothetical protein ANCCAN_15433 [Ancylostoma caninum]
MDTSYAKNVTEEVWKRVLESLAYYLSMGMDEEGPEMAELFHDRDYKSRRSHISRHSPLLHAVTTKKDNAELHKDFRDSEELEAVGVGQSESTRYTYIVRRCQQNRGIHKIPRASLISAHDMDQRDSRDCGGNGTSRSFALRTLLKHSTATFRNILAVKQTRISEHSGIAYAVPTLALTSKYEE